MKDQKAIDAALAKFTQAARQGKKAQDARRRGADPCMEGVYDAQVGLTVAADALAAALLENE